MSWFIRNIVIPKTEIIDKPGFIVLRLSDKGKETYLRELFFPEPLLIQIEDQISKKYGKSGASALYSAGKRFGFRYASTSGYPLKENKSKKELEAFINIFLMYTATTFAHKIDHQIDFEKGIYKMFMDGYIVCNKNGKGFILTSGGTAGVWAYMAKNPNMEAVQTRCQGLGDKRCIVISAPPNELKDYSKNILIERDLSGLELSDRYKKINLIRPAQHASLSLKNLLDSRFFLHDSGFIQRKNLRYALCESSLIYLIEEELVKKIGAGEKLFQISKEFGKSVAKLETPGKVSKFLTDYLSSLGWGDIHMVADKKIKVICSYFPWSEFSENSTHIIYRGMVSGLLSQFFKREIDFREFKTHLSKNGMDLTIYEK
jgi:predicted hydrocarbon binding protein